MSSLKILAFGSFVDPSIDSTNTTDKNKEKNSRLKQFIKKLSAMNERHGPFDFMVGCGDFCLNELEMDTDLIVPVPTYIIHGIHGPPPSFSDSTASHDQPRDICKNLVYLGSCGMYTTAQGVRLAYVSGVQSGDSVEGSSAKSTFTLDQIQRLAQRTFPVGQPSGVDILLTYAYPQGIDAYSAHPLKPSPNTSPSTSSTALRNLSLALKPRYHFSGGPSHFWEREPYRNPHNHATRFLALAPFGNPNKDRWFYAMHLVPMVSIEPALLRAEPAGCTENPFPLGGAGSGSGMKRRGEEEDMDYQRFEQPSSSSSGDALAKKQRTDVPPEGYLCKICSSAGHFIHDCPEKRGARSSGGGPPDGYVCRICQKPGHYIKHCPEKTASSGNIPSRLKACWFCLSNPDIAKHLIVSIGEESYLCLPKGGLVPYHVLIVPIEHAPNSFALALDTADTSTPTAASAEIETYTEAVRAFLRTRQMDAVVFETHVRAQHCCLQLVPVPEALVPDLPALFRQAGQHAGFEFENFSPATHQHPSMMRRPFFRVVLPSGEHLIHFPEGNFDVQFGRAVLAKALGIPDRVDWKRCAMTEKEEMDESEAFKHLFKSFDFTLDEEE